MLSRNGPSKGLTRRLTEDFLQKEGSRFHQAFGLSLEPPDLLPATQDLERVLNEYNATADKDRRLDIGTCTLDDVIQELDDVEAWDSAKAKGAKNIPRATMRLAGQYSDAISPWLDLIPSDHGLSYLSAGLKILLNIVKGNFENRTRILKAFKDIPRIIIQTKDRQDQFASVARLREEAVALYTTLVTALADLIALLHTRKSKSSVKDGLKRVGQRLHPTDRAEKIDQILTSVQSSTDNFKECLKNVKNQVSIDTHYNTAAVLSNTDELVRTGQENQVIMARIARDVQSLKESRYTRYQNIVDCVNTFLMSDLPPWFMHRSRPAINNPIALPRAFLSMLELFECLRVPPKSAVEDVDFLLKGANKLDPQAQIQAQQLFTSMEFSRWMSSTHAETLFVQGNLNVVGAGRTSAMSAVCAALFLNLSKNTDAVVLLFSCGLHERSENPTSGPNGLIRSLITQLLLQCQTISLDFIDNRAFAEDIQSHSLSALRALFVRLVERLPQTSTVICILDGLAQFESRAWRRDLMDIIQTLNNIIRNHYLQPVVKLLVTSPFANMGKVERTISPCQVLTLRRTGIRGGRRLTGLNRILDDRIGGERRTIDESDSCNSCDMEETDGMSDDETDSDYEYDDDDGYDD